MGNNLIKLYILFSKLINVPFFEWTGEKCTGQLFRGQQKSHDWRIITADLEARHLKPNAFVAMALATSEIDTNTILFNLISSSSSGFKLRYVHVSIGPG